MMDEGTPVPDIVVTLSNGARVSLASLDTPLVVYFYPKDNTPGCTREAQDFTRLAPDFAAAGVRVIGVSRDSPAKHARFTAKHGLTVDLASDEDGAACQAFGTWGEKQLYGRTYMGVERATFLFGADSHLVRCWRKVRVPGHAEAVLASIRDL